MLKQRVIHILEEALDSLGRHADRPPVRLENARDEKFGDYACTIAMDKRVRELYAVDRPEWKNPKVFAQALLDAALELPEGGKLFASAEVAGPGFLNLTVSGSVLWEYARQAIEDGRADYGKSRVDSPRKIIFEFVSANPTGPLNVVSARAAALGDSCCNLLEAAGEEVYREFYVNDFGNQAQLLGRSCLFRYLEREGCTLKFAKKAEEIQAGDAVVPGDPDGKFFYLQGNGLRFPAGGYHGEYVQFAVDNILAADPSLQLPAETLEELRQASRDEDLDDAAVIEGRNLAERAEALGRAAMQYFQHTQKRDLERFRVRFDNFFSERTLHEDGKVLNARNALGDAVYVDEGKTFLRTTDYGDDKDRVIIRDDGRPTYFLADIAYHKTKLDRGFSHVYNIWGPDHHGYIKRLEGAMQALGHPEEGFRVLIAQQVNLLRGGEPVRMSKRAGNLITMEEVMDEVPVDVSRYFFVMRSFDSHLDYDLEDARDESDKNPYYYVAYAHARIRSIFRKAAEQGLQSVGSEGLAWNELPEIELTPERRRLLYLTARFPEEVHDAALSIEPHRLVTYLFHLATAVSQFYGQKENKIIEQEPKTAALLLALTDAAATALKNGLALLGMEAPERMVREEDEGPNQK